MNINRLEHNVKGEPHGIEFQALWMQKWNKSKESARRLDKKNLTITQEVNMVTKQMTTLFYLFFELYPLVYFISAFQDLQNSIP